MTSDVRTGDTGERAREVDPAAPETPSGQVRIVGAERAAGLAGRTQETAEPGHEDAGPEEGFGPEDWQDLVEPRLPHWTEAPTGEVPAVLARPDDEARPAVSEPSWREDPGDWDLDAFGGSILDEEGSGGLGDTDLAERQPWSFELGAEAEDADGLEELGLEELEPTGRGLFESWPGAEDGEQAGAGGEAATVQGWDEPDGDEDAAGSDETPFDDGSRDDTATLPVTEHPAASRSGVASATDFEEEAAALAADLEAHGLRRLLRRSGMDGLQTSPARHRAKPPPRPPAPPARTAARADESVSERAGRNMPAAIASGLVIGAVTLVAFRFGTVPSMVVVTAVLGLAAVEAYAAFRRAGYRPVTVLGLAAVVAAIVGSYDRTFAALPVVLVVLLAATFLWHLVGVDPKAEPVRSAASTLFVFCWVGVFGSFAALLLAPALFPQRHGIAYLLGALIAAVAYDVGALGAGAWLGRHPLSSVSPGKTWEGVAGGAVAAIVLSVALVRVIHPWTLGEAAALGVVVAVVSPVGDLCESLVKRHLGLKDMGRILPGHGGLLDRVDGLLFVLPATYYLVRAFGHG